KKTPAQPAKSQPAAKPEKKAPKKTKFQEFAELELAEEKSREKELENQRLQTLQRREQVTWEGKVELAREERKAAERKMKHEARMKQMEQQHEFRMQMLRSQAGMTILVLLRVLFSLRISRQSHQMDERQVPNQVITPRVL
ncbi:hypothetical protein V5O48_015349, partial [Marasmius crinis-equi]